MFETVIDVMVRMWVFAHEHTAAAVIFYLAGLKLYDWLPIRWPLRLIWLLLISTRLTQALIMVVVFAAVAPWTIYREGFTAWCYEVWCFFEFDLPDSERWSVVWYRQWCEHWEALA